MSKYIIAIAVLTCGWAYFLIPPSTQSKDSVQQSSVTANQHVDTARTSISESYISKSDLAEANKADVDNPATWSAQTPVPIQFTPQHELRSSYSLLKEAKKGYRKFLLDPTGAERNVLLSASNLLRACSAIPKSEAIYVDWSLTELPHNRAEADAFYNLCRDVGTSATEFEHLEKALSPLLDAGDTDAAKQYIDWVALQGEYFEREKVQSTISAILQENDRFRLATGLQLNARLNKGNPVELNVSESVLLHIANLHGSLNADLTNFMSLRVKQGLSELTPSQYSETVTRIEQLKDRYQKIYTGES